MVALARQASPPAWLGPAVWALLILVVTTTAWRLARALCGQAPLLIVGLATSLLGLVLASLGVAWLGLAGALSLGAALLFTGAAATAVIRYVPLAPTGRGAAAAARATPASRAAPAHAAIAQAPGASRPPAPSSPPAAATPPARTTAPGISEHDPVTAAAVALAAAAIGLVLLSQARDVTSSVDGLRYHLPMVAEWMQHGSIWAVGGLSTIYQGYPGFRESILLFLSLPLHQEHLALLGFVEFPLFALAVFALATVCGAPPRLGALLAAYAVSAPVVARTSTSQQNDLLLAIAFALAAIFSARLVERPTRGHGVLTGAALGALAATRFTGIGYALAVVAVGVGRRLLRLRRSGRPAALAGLRDSLGSEALEAHEPGRNGTPATRGASSSWRGAGGLPARGSAPGRPTLASEVAPWLWAAGAALLVAGPWYARNLVAFANPLYPAEVTLGSFVQFAGPLDRAAIAAETVGWNPRPLLDASGEFVQAYGPLIPLAGLGTLVLAVAALARRPAGRRHAWLLALAAAGVVIFVHQPLTFRHFTPAFVVLSVAALSAASAAPRVVAAATAVLLVAGTLINVAAWAPGWWVALAAVLAAAAAGWTAARPAFRVSLPRLRLRRVRRPSMAGGVLGALVALAIVAAGLNALRARWQYHAVYGYPAALADRAGVGGVWAHVHRTLSHQRIVAYGMEPTFPLYGDDLSNRVVAVREPLDPEALLQRCEAEHADYLVVFFPVPDSDPRWSPTMAGQLLADHPDRVALALASDRTYLLKIVQRP